ncbi:MAG: hypothetical protein ACRD2B_17000 [Terriglobia bacterium]
MLVGADIPRQSQRSFCASLFVPALSGESNRAAKAGRVHNPQISKVFTSEYQMAKSMERTFLGKRGKQWQKKSGKKRKVLSNLIGQVMMASEAGEKSLKEEC